MISVMRYVNRIVWKLVYLFLLILFIIGWPMWLVFALFDIDEAMSYRRDWERDTIRLA